MAAKIFIIFSGSHLGVTCAIYDWPYKNSTFSNKICQKSQELAHTQYPYCINKTLRAKKHFTFFKSDAKTNGGHENRAKSVWESSFIEILDLPL